MVPIRPEAKVVVPLIVVLPPILALFVNSKLLETEALVLVRRPMPVMLLELAVKRPPNVKALMVKVPARDWIVPLEPKLI